jgi:hypothetical protein
MSCRYRAGDTVKAKSFEAIKNYLVLNGFSFSCTGSSIFFTIDEIVLTISSKAAGVEVSIVTASNYHSYYTASNGRVYRDWMLE